MPARLPVTRVFQRYSRFSHRGAGIGGRTTRLARKSGANVRFPPIADLPYSSKPGVRACPHPAPRQERGELSQGRGRAAHQRCLDALDQDGAPLRYQDRGIMDDVSAVVTSVGSRFCPGSAGDWAAPRWFREIGGPNSQHGVARTAPGDCDGLDRSRHPARSRAELPALRAAASGAPSRGQRNIRAAHQHVSDNATPNTPPSERKNASAEVATVPSADAFWIATARFGMTNPSSAPVRTSAASIAGSGAVSCHAAAIATTHKARDQGPICPCTGRPPITEATINPAISGAVSQQSGIRWL